MHRARGDAVYRLTCPIPPHHADELRAPWLLLLTAASATAIINLVGRSFARARDPSVLFDEMTEFARWLPRCSYAAVCMSLLVCACPCAPARNVTDTGQQR